MTRKTATPAPEAEIPVAPLPSEGGSYMRNPDGSLTRRDEDAPAADMPAEEA
jgi:hypothetical protein